MVLLATRYLAVNHSMHTRNMTGLSFDRQMHLPIWQSVQSVYESFEGQVVGWLLGTQHVPAVHMQIYLVETLFRIDWINIGSKAAR